MSDEQSGHRMHAVLAIAQTGMKQEQQAEQAVQWAGAPEGEGTNPGDGHWRGARGAAERPVRFPLDLSRPPVRACLREGARTGERGQRSESGPFSRQANRTTDRGGGRGQGNGKKGGEREGRTEAGGVTGRAGRGRGAGGRHADTESAGTYAVAPRPSPALPAPAALPADPAQQPRAVLESRRRHGWSAAGGGLCPPPQRRPKTAPGARTQHARPAGLGTQIEALEAQRH